jgi:hypothetical protein
MPYNDPISSSSISIASSLFGSRRHRAGVASPRSPVLLLDRVHLYGRIRRFDEVTQLRKDIRFSSTCPIRIRRTRTRVRVPHDRSLPLLLALALPLPLLLPKLRLGALGPRRAPP